MKVTEPEDAHQPRRQQHPRAASPHVHRHGPRRGAEQGEEAVGGSQEVVWAAELAHGRVIRAISRNAIGRPHDQRIAESSTRRIEPPATELSAWLGLA